MELKTYQGKSMAEALEKVKKDLGRGAVILHTRTVRRGGVMGVGARSVVEITASKEPTLLPKAERAGADRPVAVARASSAEVPVAIRQAASSYGASTYAPSVARIPGTDRTTTLEQIFSSTSALRGEMEELRTMVRQLLERQLPEESGAVGRATGLGQPALPIPEELHAYYTQLIQNAVADELAREVISRAKERLNEWRTRLQSVASAKSEPFDFQKLIPNALTDVIERMLPTADPVQIVPGRGAKFVALVGPTGVGKTTTIAKLAAQFKLREHKKVGLITTDTYRIAAVAQLKAYAEIMSVPLEVVYTADDLGEMMRKMQGFDVVLIDTSGRSQNDSEHLGDLQAFLAKARRTADELAVAGTSASSAASAETAGPEANVDTKAQEHGEGSGDQPPSQSASKIDRYKPLETHLVLSCTAHSSQLQEVIERFAAVGIDRAVFTKLDEAVGVGVILNIAHRLDVQLSYLTTGQDVPDDIEVGSRRRIAEMVLNARKA